MFLIYRMSGRKAGLYFCWTRSSPTVARAARVRHITCGSSAMLQAARRDFELLLFILIVGGVLYGLLAIFSFR